MENNRGRLDDWKRRLRENKELWWWPVITQVADVDKIKEDRKKYKEEKNLAEENIESLREEIEILKGRSSKISFIDENVVTH